MHIVIRGTCHLEEWDVEPGEGFLQAKGQLHTFEVEPGYEHFWIAFGGTQLPAMGEMFRMDFGAHQRFVLKEVHETLYPLLKSVFENAASPEGEHKVRGLLLMLLALRTDAAEQKKNDAQRACDFMLQNYYRKISMAEVAQHISLSEKHFCRMFKREFGFTPMQYLIRIRMEKAHALLRNTEMLVKDVALTVGYPSQLAFSSAYSAYWGHPPSQDRGHKADRSCNPIRNNG